MIRFILAAVLLNGIAPVAIAQSMSNQGIGQTNMRQEFTARALARVRVGDTVGAQDILNRCGSCWVTVADLAKIAAGEK